MRLMKLVTADETQLGNAAGKTRARRAELQNSKKWERNH